MTKNDYFCELIWNFCMKNILVLIILFMPFIIDAQVLEVAGIQEGIWDYDTVLVVDDVVVPKDKSLTIVKGTNVIFKDYFSITINGSVKALGSEADSIYFTSRDTTGFFKWGKGIGGWNGLVLQNVSDTIILDYCHFSFGKATNAQHLGYGGALKIYDADNVIISNSTFYHNLTTLKGGALYAENSNLNIFNCEVDSNFGFNEEGVYMHGAGFQFNNCEIKMENMYFHDNYCANCYGGGANFDSCYVYVNNAVFEDNYAVNAAGIGVQRCNDYEVRISNSLFNNNIAYHYGGAMAIAASSPIINNVTMTNNYTIAAGGGAMQFYSEAYPVFKNCIIWDNDWYEEHNSISDGSQIFIWGYDCKPQFYNSIIQGGFKEIHGYENIAVYDTASMLDSDPLFLDAKNRDFQLSDGSPAINSGTIDTTGLLISLIDLAGNQRVIGNRIDMGCYESDATSLKEFNTDIKNIDIYPNPINSDSKCEFILTDKSDVNVKIYNQNASLIFVRNYEEMQYGSNVIPLEDFVKSTQKNSSIYFLIIETQHETLNTKFIY